MLVIQMTVRGMDSSIEWIWGLTMKSQFVIALGAAVSTAALAGCASDGTPLLQTGSVGTTSTAVAAAPKTDPACMALIAKIDSLRQEGTPARIEKVAAGKTKTANVKREALGRMAQLDKANAEFQAKCAKAGLRASITPAKPVTPTAAQQVPAATTAASNTAATANQAAAGAAAVKAQAKATTAAVKAAATP